VRDFIVCLEQVIVDFRLNYSDEDERRGGGMSADTPVWVCAYANNQWALGENILEDPNQSGFTRAMEVANGRTITILDNCGIVFSRILCIFELFLTIVDTKHDKDGLWAVYTAHTQNYKHPWGDGEEERKALGIISGGSTSDNGYSDRIAARETSFPFELIKKSLSIQVECAQASVECDRVHILNTMVGRPINQLDNAPPTTHYKHAELNNGIQFYCSQSFTVHNCSQNIQLYSCPIWKHFF